MRIAVGTSVVGCICVALLVSVFVRPVHDRRDFPRWALHATCLTLVLSFALVYPVANRHVIGQGSDREDALRVELEAITHHRYPYDAKTFLGHRPTPLPGATLLAWPFYLAGRIALQNLFWAGAFIVTLLKYFARRATAIVFVMVLLCGALENLNDFDVGGDYMTNIMYVAVAIFLCDRMPSTEGNRSLAILCLIFFGVTLSSRVIFVVALPPLIKLIAQRSSWHRAIVAFALIVASSLLVTLPVLAPHPIVRLLRQLGQNSDKMAFLPGYLPAGVLAALAIAVACCNAMSRVDLPKIYLTVGVCTFIMISPPMASIVLAHGGLTTPLPTDLEYLAAPAVFICLWAFKRLETGPTSTSMHLYCTRAKTGSASPLKTS